ncbi:hypothetical protein [Candidatus Nitrosocosmicus sp. SS]|uniref:hypothetical protein n=1 Tax=Candidatus Nitrosocosmicus agrestis TaxID=2563600 RepID=UPI00122E4B7B|nr:hypothetical protein [Candidatus Nitrosocosmicus sp. SS]KAA2282193.1 hypothetical protein F1Z66_07125 [Candidatus Nitrosocosmicus sp. SS]KAF0869959.1 hypothetical protein E5N71_01680 [Candidatus Nitrosocosmicus sp. SS]
MLSYDRLSKKPSLFKSYTGLSVQQFDSLFQIIESRYAKYEIKRLSEKIEKEKEQLELAGTLSSLSRIESSWYWCTIVCT